MKKEISKLYTKSITLGVVIFLAGSFTGGAQDVKATDPFVKGNPSAARYEFILMPSTNAGMMLLKSTSFREVKVPEPNMSTNAGMMLLKSIIIPQIEFRETNIRSALDCLAQVAAEQDPQKRCVNFILNLKKEQEPPLTLSLHQVSLYDVLTLMVKCTCLAFKI